MWQRCQFAKESRYSTDDSYDGKGEQQQVSSFQSLKDFTEESILHKQSNDKNVNVFNTTAICKRHLPSKTWTDVALIEQVC